MAATLVLLLTVYALDAKRRADGPQWITAAPAAVSAERQQDRAQPLPSPVTAAQGRPVGAVTAPAHAPMVPIVDDLQTGRDATLLPRLVAADTTTTPAAAAQPAEGGSSAIAVVAGGSTAAALAAMDTAEAASGSGLASVSSAATTPLPGPPPPAATTLAYGQRGLDEALRGGLIRPAGSDDLRRWAAARTRQGDANAGALQLTAAMMSRTFVIERGFEWPQGMHDMGAMVFMVEPGVPYPRGDAGQSAVLDLGTGACRGAACGQLVNVR